MNSNGKVLVKRNKENKSDLRRLIKSVIVMILIEIAKVTVANPCPVESPLYGGAILKGSSDEINEYFVVADDDFT